MFPLFVFFFAASYVRAQVLVHEEPRHHVVFENDKIRILNVLIPPGDTTLYHIHHTPSLFLYFSTTTTFSQLQNAPATTGRGIRGKFIFENLSSPNVRVHRVWNVDTIRLHVMDIELLSKVTGFEQDPLVLRHLQLSIDTPWVRVYRLTLEPGNEFSLSNSRYPSMLVSMDTAAVQIQQGSKSNLETRQAGSFLAIKTGQSFALKNAGTNTANFALIELPGK